MLRKYWEEVAPTVQPIAVEQKFEIQLETMPGVIILGYFDLITEDGGIIDHKTAGSTTHKQWTQAYVDRMHQLTIYDLAYRKLFKKEPNYLGIDVLKRMKEGPQITRLRTERSSLQILALAQLMKRMKDIQES